MIIILNTMTMKKVMWHVCSHLSRLPLEPPRMKEEPPPSPFDITAAHVRACTYIPSVSADEAPKGPDKSTCISRRRSVASGGGGAEYVGIACSLTLFTDRLWHSSLHDKASLFSRIGGG